MRCTCSGLKWFSCGFSWDGLAVVSQVCGTVSPSLVLPQAPEPCGTGRSRHSAWQEQTHPGLGWPPKSPCSFCCCSTSLRPFCSGGQLHFEQEAHFEGMATGFKNRLSFFLKSLQFPHSRSLWGRRQHFSIPQADTPGRSGVTRL